MYLCMWSLLQTCLNLKSAEKLRWLKGGHFLAKQPFEDGQTQASDSPAIQMDKMADYWQMKSAIQLKS